MAGSAVEMPRGQELTETTNWTASADAHEKLAALEDYLRQLGSVAVAFSAGVDSTFLTEVAHRVLGDNMVAITAQSELVPERECSAAEEFCRQRGIRHLVIDEHALEIPGFSHNPTNRCYLCKKNLFTLMLGKLDDLGVTYLCEGSNMDDMGDYRPGLQAIAELQVESPLRQAKLYKQDIRDLSREMGLPTWDKPSFACLASRFAYDEEITRQKLDMVDRAEQFLVEHGFGQMRVRVHGEPAHGCVARIEVTPGQMPKVLDLRTSIDTAFREYGFAYVTMDLRGYRTGAMNETLADGGAAAGAGEKAQA